MRGKEQDSVIQKRRIEIINLLKNSGGMSVKMLADTMHVSEMTIRRDLKELCQINGVQMTQGVAFLKHNTAGLVYDVLNNREQNHQLKDMIGRTAASMVRDGDVVFMDVGTTTAMMAHHLNRNMDITVVCSTMNVLQTIYEKNVAHIIATGGFYHKETQMFECEEALKMLGNVRLTKAFVSAAGASEGLGLTCMHKYEIQTKRLALQNAQTTILLCDSTKFGKVRPVFFGDWRQIHTVITDHGMTQEWRNFFAENNIEVIFAENGSDCLST